MFKTLINSIKLGLINRLLRELCDGRCCGDCKACLEFDDLTTPRCAQCYVLDQALKAWGCEEGNDEDG